MPKLKTHKVAKARFKITGTGKIMRTRQGKSHLRRNKSKSVKRNYYKMIEISPADVKRIKPLLPYGA